MLGCATDVLPMRYMTANARMITRRGRSLSVPVMTTAPASIARCGAARIAIGNAQAGAWDDRPSRHAREVRYARRELLGMTAQDRENLLDAVIAHMTDGI